MKVLIVGGTGLTGAHAALHLEAAGHSVTLMARKPPTTPCLSHFDFKEGNYLDEGLSSESLIGFDSLLFAAGADIRMVPSDQFAQADDFFHQANTIAIPKFIEKAKQAGISKVVYVGTYYPQIAPDKIASSAYVRSRHLADEAIRAMSCDEFNVCSLNAPFILGHVDGLIVPHLEAMVNYVAGRIEGLELIAPAGAVNHIASQSLSEAIADAFNRGESGKAYLLGDENISWKDYLETFCAAAGKPLTLAITREEHPMFPDIMLYAGRNAVVSYEADNSLNYSRNQIADTIKLVTQAYL
jgi:nucleoside-diphosphate-sugar epimerase